MTTALNDALSGVPATIRPKLISAYTDLKRNLAESRDEAAGMSAGKLCEATIRLLQQRVFGVSTPFGKKITNFADECRRIVTSTASVNESEKLIIPRALVFLYTMRNTRGIGHIGGDIDPNAIDGAVMGSVADWIICELIRVHHGMPLEEAQDLIDALAVRRIPTIWEVGGKKRVMQTGLPARDEALLLLYASREASVLTEDLVEWIEYSNPHVFKSNVLSKLHQQRLIEWDRDTESVILSPKGAADVEARLLVPDGATSSKGKKR